MTHRGIPDVVVTFLIDRIDSVEQLEVLLLLQQTPETAWTGESVARTSIGSPPRGNGREALALVERNGRKLDLVLTDLAMPEMGGRELAGRLALLQPELAVLFMSGYTGEDIQARGLLAPGAPLQPKPFTPEMLAAKVRQMLDARTSHPPAPTPALPGSA